MCERLFKTLNITQRLYDRQYGQTQYHIGSHEKVGLLNFNGSTIEIPQNKKGNPIRAISKTHKKRYLKIIERLDKLLPSNFVNKQGRGRKTYSDQRVYEVQLYKQMLEILHESGLKDLSKEVRKGGWKVLTQIFKGGETW